MEISIMRKLNTKKEELSCKPKQSDCETLLWLNRARSTREHIQVPDDLVNQMQFWSPSWYVLMRTEVIFWPHYGRKIISPRVE